MWDFTCCDTLAPSHLHQSSDAAGGAALAAEKRKIAKYTNLARDFHFVPIAVETLGSFGPAALSFLKDLGRRISFQTGDARATTFLFQRIACAIVRHNAAAVLSSFPVDRGLDELFLL
jgi:hypothetical protein